MIRSNWTPLAPGSTPGKEHYFSASYSLPLGVRLVVNADGRTGRCVAFHQWEVRDASGYPCLRGVQIGEWIADVPIDDYAVKAAAYAYSRHAGHDYKG